MSSSRSTSIEQLRQRILALRPSDEVSSGPDPALPALRAQLAELADHKLLVELLGGDTHEVYVVNAETFRFLEASAAAVANLGYSLEELRTKTPLDVIDPESRLNVKQLLAATQGLQGGSLVMRTLHRRKDGTSYPLEVTLLLMESFVLAVGRPVDAQRSRDRRKDQVLDDLCTLGDGWIAATDANLTISYASEEVQRITGYSDEEILGASPALWKSGKLPQSFYRRLWSQLNAGQPVRQRFINRRRDGSLFAVDQTIAPLPANASEPGAEKEMTFVSAGQVVHEVPANGPLAPVDTGPHQAVEQHLRYLAYIDPLTNLPNRVLFTELLDRTLLGTKSRSQEGALLLVDINRFVYVNKTYGSEVGDYLLQQLALRLGRLAGDTNPMARIGDDEFAVLVEQFTHPEELILLADRIRSEASAPIDVEGKDVRLSVSVGIATFPERDDDAHKIVSRCSMALASARKASHNDCVFFTDDLNKHASEFLALKHQLIDALEQRQVTAAYQPIYSHETGKMVALEALMRWKGSVGPGPLSKLSAAHFIPALEEMGLIVLASDLMIDRVCQDLRGWIDAGHSVVPVALNLSADQLHDPNIVEHLASRIGSYQLDHQLFTLEVTESVCMKDADQAIGVLEDLRNAGFRIAIDDFGTGYSSLSYLKRMPVDRLKIDMSFVHGVHEAEDATIIGAIVSMARCLNVDTVAEGIESMEQLQAVRDLGCDMGQGFFLARPLSTDVLSPRLGEDHPAISD